MRLILWIVGGLVVALIVAGIALTIVGARVLRQFTKGSASRTSAAGANGEPALRAKVELERHTEGSGDRVTFDAGDRVTVVFQNGKSREVETPGLEVGVNGQPLEYLVRTGNYYDRHPYYRLPRESTFRIEPDTVHQFTLRRTNGTTVELAQVRTPKGVTVRNFRVPREHRSNADLVVAWTGLQQPMALVAYKSHSFRDEHGNDATEAGSGNSPDALRRTIGAGGLTLPDGQWVIPASYFQAPNGRTVSMLGLEFLSVGAGKVGPEFDPGSEVRAVRRVVFNVDVLKP